MPFLYEDAMRDWKTITSDHTGRRGRKFDTHQSSPVPRIPFPNTPQSIQTGYYYRDFESVSRMTSRLHRRTKAVERDLSVLSIYGIPYFGRPWFAYLDYHHGDIEPKFDKSSRLRLHQLRHELQKVEKDILELHMLFEPSVSGILWEGVFSSPSLISHLESYCGDLKSVFKAFDHEVFGPSNFLLVSRRSRLFNSLHRLVLQGVERKLLVLYSKYKRLLKLAEPQPLSIRKRYERKKSRKQIIDRPWTDFPVEQKQQGPRVNPNAYRPLVGRHSGHEPKGDIIRQTTNSNDLQAQKEPSDERAISSFIDMSKNSLRNVSDWKLREGRSKEWRRCQVLKVLSSSRSDAHAVKGNRLDSLRWEKAAAIAPIAMLERDPWFGKAHEPRKQVANEYRRKDTYKRSCRARAFEIEAEAFYDEPVERSAPSDEPVCSFEDIRQEMPVAPPFLIPYENYIGAILGGQFQLGPLVRQEPDGNVYLVESLNRSTLKLEAKAYTLAELSQSQRKATKKLRQQICSIDQAGKKFVVYRVDATSQDNRRKQQHSMLQTPDAHSSNNRSSRSSVAQLHRSSKTERAGETETGKTEPRIIVARESKTLTPKVGNSHDEAAGNSFVADVRTRQQKRLISKNIPKLPTMKAVDNSQEKDVPEKKKRKRRNRGLKKAKVPRFDTPEELQSFLAIIDSRLRLRRRELSPQRPWHSKMAKTTAAMQRQYDDLSSRLFRARMKEYEWWTLRWRISDKLDQWMPIIDEEEQFDLEWRLRKNFPFGIRSNKKHSPLPQLLDYYQVFDSEDLYYWEWEQMEEIEKILNGEEGRYCRT